MEEYIPTVGVEFVVHNLTYGDNNYKLQIWDTAGEERFKAITSAYLRGAALALILFDKTNKETL